MSYIEEFRPPESTWLDIAFDWFIRLLAVVFVGFAILSWLRIIGFFPGDNWRFDTMSDAWKIAGAVLAVLHPVVAVGLWTLLSWGQVVWVLAIAIEITMYGLFPGFFGTNPMLVNFHLGCIAVFLVLRAAAYYKVKKG